MQTIVPTTGIMQRYGYGDHLYRVVTVCLYANKACKGGGDLHQVNAIRVENGERAFWFATDDDARNAGWLQ